MSLPAAASGPPDAVRPAPPSDPADAPTPGPGRLVHAWARTRRNPGLLAGLGLLGAFVGAAAFSIERYGGGRNAPPVDFAVANLVGLAPGPSPQHLLGTDRGLGVDVLSAILRATPNDLAIVGTILLLAAVTGLLAGGWAGLAGGAADLAVLWSADLLVGVPPFFLVIVLFLGVAPLAPPGDSLAVFALLFAVVLWPYYARPVRAVAQRTAAEPFVESARAAGAGADRLLFRHILPNSLFPVLAQLPVDVFNVFFVLTVFPYISCLSPSAFAPLSVTPSALYPEWGSLLGYGACYGWSILPELDAWWSYVFPAATIFLFGLMVVLLCDGLDRQLGAGRRR